MHTNDFYRGDVTRGSWGGNAYSGKSPWQFDRIRGIAIHHSVTDAPFLHADCAAVVRSILHTHLAKGYRTIAYNAVICSHGYVFRGRWFMDQSGANGTQVANQSWFSVCFLGSGPSVTLERVYAFASVRRRLLERAPFAKKVVPHSDFTPTSCPGDRMREWIGNGGPRIDPIEAAKVVHRALNRYKRSIGK